MPNTPVQSNQQNISPMNNNAPQQYVNNVPVKKPGLSLGKSEFLNLLMKQLTHQNPLKPMNDRDFISQMAQFSALEQMQNVAKGMNDLKNISSKSMRNMEANSMIGKKISGKDFVTQQPVSGIVQSVIRDQSGKVFLNLKDHIVNLNDVLKVENPGSVSRETISPIDMRGDTAYKENQKINKREGELVK